MRRFVSPPLRPPLPAASPHVLHHVRVHTLRHETLQRREAPHRKQLNIARVALAALLRVVAGSQ